MSEKRNSALQRLSKIPTAMVGLFIILSICVVALLSALGIELTPFAYDQTTTSYLAGPSFEHPMGTDELGRDLLARVIYGARLSISIGLTTALTAFLIGSVYGAIAGFAGSKIDGLMMRGVDIAYSLPDLLVMILVACFWGAVLRVFSSLLDWSAGWARPAWYGPNFCN